MYCGKVEKENINHLSSRYISLERSACCYYYCCFSNKTNFACFTSYCIPQEPGIQLSHYINKKREK